MLSEATKVRSYNFDEHKDKKRRVESDQLHTWRKMPLSGLMQRILTFLFKRAKNTGKKA